MALLLRKRRRPWLPLRLQLRRRRLLQRLVLLLLQGRGGAAWSGRAPLRRASSLRQRLHRCHLCPAGMQCQFRVPQKSTVHSNPGHLGGCSCPQNRRLQIVETLPSDLCVASASPYLWQVRQVWRWK